MKPGKNRFDVDGGTPEGLMRSPTLRQCAHAPLSVCRRAVRIATVLVALTMLAWSGCARYYAKQADEYAYGIIGQKQQVAIGEKTDFSIDYDPIVPSSGDELTEANLLRGLPIPLGDAKPRVLSLDECLEIGVRNSRPYQNTKETLYITALALANSRHDWSFFGGDFDADASWRATGKEGPSVKTGSAGVGMNFTQRFIHGGVVTLAAGLDIVTSFSGLKNSAFGSLLEANITQPLWRGAWRGFAYEDLYRAERNLAYAVFEYDRFTQTFAVDIATDYYSVLQRRDTLDNDIENVSRLQRTFDFIDAQEDAGLRGRVEAYQAQQDLLNARAYVEIARQRYRDRLDQYKLTLGLPIASAVELDQDELKRLKPMPMPLDEASAIVAALRARPDVLTEYANVRDAVRDVEIAADDFNPRIDLVLDASASSTSPQKPWKTQLHRHTRGAAISVDYNFDQTDNRDAYRRSQIRLARAARDLDLFLDTVRLDVRASYRTLTQSRNTYNIRQESVTLAIRRTA